MTKKEPKLHFAFSIEEIACLLVSIDLAQRDITPVQNADRYNDLLIKIGDQLHDWILNGKTGQREAKTPNSNEVQLKVPSFEETLKAALKRDDFHVKRGSVLCAYDRCPSRYTVQNGHAWPLAIRNGWKLANSDGTDLYCNLKHNEMGEPQYDN